MIADVVYGRDEVYMESENLHTTAWAKGLEGGIVLDTKLAGDAGTIMASQRPVAREVERDVVCRFNLC